MAITISGQSATSNQSINAPRNSQSLASYLNENQNVSVSLSTTADGINLTSFGRTDSGTVWRLRNGTSTDIDGTLTAYRTDFSNIYALPINTDTFVLSPIFTTHILEADGTTKIKAASKNTFTGGGTIGGDAYRIIGGSGDDTIRGRSQNDTLLGGGGDDLLRGQGGNDRLSGQGGDDTLTGGGGDDTLTGGGGEDLLEGQGGDDLLTGGRGDDTLTGGSGRDKFRFTNQGIDEITDFRRNPTNGDIFQIRSNRYPNAPVAGTNAVVGTVGTANANIYVDTFNNIGTSSGVNFAYATNTDQLLYDADGDWTNGSVVIANTNNLGTPTAANFEFI